MPSPSPAWQTDPAVPAVAERRQPESQAGSVGETLRYARRHQGLSLREVERRTGRANAYLSQVERGIIRRPDPAVIWELSQLYGLNFDLLAQWADLAAPDGGEGNRELSGRLIRLVLNLGPEQRVRLLKMIEDMMRQDRT
jgi:HTH-type transcriptional regulator, competence development regulator